VVILIAQTPHSILKDSVYETTSGKELSILGHCRFAERCLGKHKPTYRYLSVLDERIVDLALVEIEQLLDSRD
jgi:hypothetical protein